MISEQGDAVPPRKDSTPLLNGETNEVQVYAIRWVILIVFAIGAIVNAITWISFAPISEESSVILGVSYEAINMLSLCFLIAYIPGSILSVWMLDAHGLAASLSLAAWLTAVGCWVRYLGVILLLPKGHTTASFVVMMVGQILAALAQPMYVNVPSRLSGDWFAVKEREAATTIGSMAGPLGNAFGSFVPTLIVSAGAAATRLQFDRLLVLEAGLATGVAIGLYLVARDRPPTPPSTSTEARVIHRALSLHRMASAGSEAGSHHFFGAQDDHDGEGEGSYQDREGGGEKKQQEEAGAGAGIVPASPPVTPVTPAMPGTGRFAADEEGGKEGGIQSLDSPRLEALEKGVDGAARGGAPNLHLEATEYAARTSALHRLGVEVWVLLHDGPFLRLTLAMGCGVGLFNSFLTLMAQVVAPCGYDSGAAGIFGAILIVSGLVGAVVAGVVLEKCQAHTTIIRCWAVGCMAATVLFVLLLRRDMQVPLAVSFGILGFAILPLLPLTFEVAAEHTYPIPEDSSAAVLMSSGQIFGMIFIFSQQALLQLQDRCVMFPPICIFLIVAFAVGLAFMMSFEAEPRRSKFDRKQGTLLKGKEAEGLLGVGT